MTIKKRLLSLTCMILILLTSFASTLAVEYKLVNEETIKENTKIVKIEQSYLRDIKNIELKGNKVFNDISDIVRFKVSKNDFSYIQDLAEKGYDAYEISRYAQLGVENINFVDTEKPNCVFIYPKRDKTNAFEEEKALELFEKIKSEYDVYVVFAEQEKEIYEALNAIENIELFIIAGHGTSKSISLGENDLRTEGAEFDETYTLDVYDFEMEYNLDNLNENAVIFLYACSTGDGEKNLADNMFKMTNAKVISAKDAFYSSNIEVVSLYPFDVKIVRDGENITYVPVKNYNLIEKQVKDRKDIFDLFKMVF